MEKYILKYPKSEQDIYALVFTFGEKKANEICNEALLKNKEIELITNDDIDFLDYKLK
jgi:hypothetical protein